MTVVQIVKSVETVRSNSCCEESDASTDRLLKREENNWHYIHVMPNLQDGSVD